MSLDIKFRPQVFDEVIGQDIIVLLLKAIIIQQKFSSAYMFSGPSGVGKTTMGRIFSKTVLCENPIEGNPCCVCLSCISFQEDRHFGYQEMDAASSGNKEEMVKLRDEAAFVSVGKKKIILLDECHDISKQGQDALLKQVEQCPPHLIYIFCTTEPEKVNKTLRKRCIHFQVSQVDPPNIFNRLKIVCAEEGIQYEEDALYLIANKARGHVRDSLKLLEEVSFLGPITVETVQKVSADYSGLVCSILSNLGTNLNESLSSCRKISSLISPWDLYEQLITMISDAVQFFYGYDDFIPQRKELLLCLRNTHGSNLMEFLSYLLSRDKFIDRIGLQSDIILLHYKFCANSFKPQIPIQPQIPVQSQDSEKISPQPVEVPKINPEKIPETSSSVLTYAELSKMTIIDRSKALRSHRQNHNETDQKEETQKVPVNWSLPKEERQGANSFDDVELSPLEFSNILVGGRGGGV